MQFVFLVLISLTEIVLFFVLVRFFSRLRRSEDLLTRLRHGQESLLDKLQANAELEREIMDSFAVRQGELTRLNRALDERIAELTTLMEQAEAISRSPQFLRELIVTGKKRGRSPAQLAKATGLSLEEVELILTQAGL